MNLIGKDWFNYGRWKQPVLSGAFWAHAHEAQSVKKVIPDCSFHPLLFLDGYTLSHVDDEAWYREYAARLIDDAEEAEAFRARLEDAALHAEQEHRALLTTGAEFSDGDYVKELFRTYNEITGVWWFPIVISNSLEALVLERGIAKDEEAMRKILAPYHRTTLLERQSQEIRSLADTIRAHFPGVSGAELTNSMLEEAPDIQEQIKDHVTRFAWFGTHHWEGEEYSYERCLADIRGALDAGTSHADEAHDAPVSDSYAHVWRLIAQFAYWRTHGAETTGEVVFHSRRRLAAVAGAWNLSYEDLLTLSAEEILERHASGTGPALPDDFTERKQAYGCVIEDGREHIVTGAELQAYVEAVVPRTDTSITEFKGVVASKGGVVMGTARIMLEPSDFPRFFEGDILVANETTPDFVPLMKKAAAIVTDTGGITSHAAIVSRELKKPCVIGTKVATQVLKDGEQVEVNAETGLVRKIS